MNALPEYALGPLGIVVVTLPEATNTGPGFNRSGDGARGCDFEERVVEYARTEGGRFL